MRKIADCRRFESENGCTLTIIGEENEVMNTAAEHAVSAHGHTDGPELREQIRTMLEPEESYVAGHREAQPFPA
jgi:predicted small metal-binding protein